MKTRKLTVKSTVLTLLLSLAALPLMAGVGVGVQINVPAPVVVVPTPAVTVQVVPDCYVWDGIEYVGVVGSQYYYLGPDNVWLILDGPRVARFHEWERGNPEWRTHAIRNERFRNDTHGNNVPSHDNHENPGNHESHERDNHESHGDHGHGKDNH